MPRNPSNAGWFAIRRSLPPSRRIALSLASFLLPITLWCAVSYLPGVWKPDVKIQISADRSDVTTVFTAGDRVSREYFPEFAAAIRTENQTILAARAAGSPPQGSRRANQRLLRHIVPLAAEHGWISHLADQQDAAIYLLWRDLALGTKTATRPPLSSENLTIIRENWRILSAASETFAFRSLPEEPLLKLIPQGKASNPVFLPAPHEVFQAGLRDLTAPTSPGETSMAQRYTASLRVIGFGFLFSCLVGIPLGILCGVFDFFSRLFEPFVDFFRYLPAPTFSTLLVAVFLAGEAPKIALVFLGTVFQMILVISKTTRLLDPALLEAAQTLGARPRQIVAHVVLPGILPNLYNDLRILLGWAWTWLVIAELIGIKSGLTEFIETQGRYRNFERVFPIIFLIGLTGFLTDQFLAWLHGLLFPHVSRAGTFSRGIARILTWPLATAAAGARDHISAREAALQNLRSKS